MEPIPDSNVSFGQATQMSKNDIDRLNRLYNCCKFTLPKVNLFKLHFKIKAPQQYWHKARLG